MVKSVFFLIQNYWPMLYGCGCRFESCQWLYSVYTNNKFSHPSYLSCVLAVAPTIVQPKTTRFYGSITVITLWGRDTGLNWPVYIVQCTVCTSIHITLYAIPFKLHFVPIFSLKCLKILRVYTTNYSQAAKTRSRQDLQLLKKYFKNIGTSQQISERGDF